MLEKAQETIGKRIVDISSIDSCLTSREAEENPTRIALERTEGGGSKAEVYRGREEEDRRRRKLGFEQGRATKSRSFGGNISLALDLNSQEENLLDHSFKLFDLNGFGRS